MGEEVIREGSWICPNCNTKNRGSMEKCSACGAVRGNVKFIYEDDGAVVSDDAGKKKALGGADWICAFCGVSSAADATKCSGCGAPREEGTQRSVQKVDIHAKDRPQQPEKVSPHGHSQPTQSGQAGVPGCFKFGCGGLILLLLVFMGFECMTFEQSMEVTSREWVRTIGIDEYTTVQHQAWENQVPNDARIVNREQKIKEYKDVLTGYKSVEETYTEQVQVGTKKVKTGVEDLGNGRFKEIYEDQPVYKDVEKTRMVQKPQYRKDPVYADYITYDRDEWKEVEKKEARGTVEEVKWPETGVSKTADNQIGNQREGTRTEFYMVILKSQKDGKTYDIKELEGKPLDFASFEKMKMGTKVPVELSGLGNIKGLKLDTLPQPAH